MRGAERNAFASLRLDDAGDAPVPRSRRSSGPVAWFGDSQREDGVRAAEEDSDDDDDDEDAWQAAPRTWACDVCTYGGNWAGADTRCALCGARRPDDAAPAAAAVVWRCDACTLDNAAGVRACEACGADAPPSRAAAAAARPRAVVASAAWPGAPPARPLPAWSCPNCTLVNPGRAEACDACGAAPSLRSSAAHDTPPPKACVACTPRRACPAHLPQRLRGPAEAAEARRMQATDAWLAWEQQGLVPLYKDADVERAALTCVDARTRTATLRTAAHAADAEAGARVPPSAEQFRDMYSRGSGADDDASPLVPFVLDTVWEEGREPRRRVALLRAAGWRHVYRGARGGVGSHPKWRRELPCGAGAQVLVFASTPSDVRAWDNDASKLQRADRDAKCKLTELGMLPPEDAAT